MLKTQSLQDMGVLVPDINPVLTAGRGARELVGLADLYNYGELSLLPGYTAKRSGPILASITNANSATTFSNGSKVVTDTTAATDFMTNTDVYKRAYPGDFLLGNDGVLYVIDSVDSDTQITLKSAYEGADASSSTSYTIIHRAWMLKQFQSASTGLRYTASQSYLTTDGGTHTNTDWRSGFGVFLDRERASSRSGSTFTGDGLGYGSATTTGRHLVCSKFRVTSSVTTSSLLIALQYAAGTSSRTFKVRINTDASGVPSSTIVGATGTEGITADYTMSQFESGDKKYKIDFTGSFTLSTGTDYWLVVATTSTGGTWVIGTDKLLVMAAVNPSSEVLIDHQGVGKYYNLTSGLHDWVAGGYTQLVDFSFSTYYTSGTNTYVGSVMDLGAVPGLSATGSASVSRSSSDYTGVVYTDAQRFLQDSSYPYASPSYPDTLTVTLKTSAAAAMTSPSTVVSAVSAATALTYNLTQQYTAATAGVNTTNNTFDLSSAPPWVVGTQVIYHNGGGTTAENMTSGNTYYIKTISSATISVSATDGGSAIDLVTTGGGAGNNAQYFFAKPLRYWQATYAMTSATGESTPLVTGVEITFTDSSASSGNGTYDVAGIGPHVYANAFGTVTSISSAEVPAGFQAGAVQYQRNLIWSTGGNMPRYWDGIAGAAAYLNAMVKSDGSTAGTNPPYRADRLALHNDKLLLYRNVSGSSQASYGPDATTGVLTRVSTTLTDVALTDTSSTWPTADNALVGFRMYPCVTDADAGYHYPLKYWIISSNTGSGSTEIATAAGANMLTYAEVGDYYLIAKFYRKAAFFSDEIEPSHWPSTNVLQFNDEDGDIIQCMVSWNGRLVTVCRDQVWLVTGYGPNSPWSKQMVSPWDGTLSPRSVVDAGDYLMWWGVRGVMAYSGGNSRPKLISDELRSIVLDYNEAAREEVVSARYRGLVLWSYPSSDSNVNNKTLIYHPETGRWSTQDFGMYCPAVFTDANGEEVLYFQSVKPEAASGGIMEWDGAAYTLGGTDQSLALKTNYFLASSPTEQAQGVRVRANIVAGGDATINVYYALEYKDEYTLVGSLEPIDSSVTGRTGVSADDTVYVCPLPAACQGSAISIQLSGTSGDSLRLLSLEIDMDAQEANTNG